MVTGWQNVQESWLKLHNKLARYTLSAISGSYAGAREPEERAACSAAKNKNEIIHQ